VGAVRREVRRGGAGAAQRVDDLVDLLRSMISGGDSAMMSPVVRISTPLLKQSRKTSKARLAGLARRSAQFDAGHQADVADVDHVGLALQRMHGIGEVALQSPARVSRPSSS
jgi:hypothetical protein